MSKKKKLKPLPTFNHLKVKQIEQAVAAVVDAYLSDSTARPTAEPISKYQESMGSVIGWSSHPSYSGPLCFGIPHTADWYETATHFTIPVRPFKYEVEVPSKNTPISNGI